MSKLKRSVQVLAVASVALLVTDARANLINLGDSAIGVNGTILGNTLTGTITYSPTDNGLNLQSEGCYAGIFSLAVNNPNGAPSKTGTIYTFCTDVGVNWKNSDTYTALQFAGQSGVQSAGNPAWVNIPTSIQNASWLYNTYFVPNSSTYISNPDEAAGMQLAIWKVLYDSAANGQVGSLNNSSGNLRASGFGGGVAFANQLIGYLDAARTGGTFTQYLDTWLDPNDNNSQGLIWNALTPVPEPTTMIAGALLLLPFGASTLRFTRKTRTV